MVPDGKTTSFKANSSWQFLAFASRASARWPCLCLRRISTSPCCAFLRSAAWTVGSWLTVGICVFKTCWGITSSNGLSPTWPQHEASVWWRAGPGTEDPLKKMQKVSKSNLLTQHPKSPACQVRSSALQSDMETSHGSTNGSFKSFT